MSTVGNNFKKIFKEDLTALQYNNAIRNIMKEIRLNGKQQIFEHLPSIYNEEFLAEKILIRILSMNAKTNLQQDRMKEFCTNLDLELCINLLDKHLKNATDNNFKLLLDYIPELYLMKEPIKSTINEVMKDKVNSASLLNSYVKNCK